MAADGGRIGTTGRVAVVGSINVDLLVRVPHLPEPGETVVGEDLVRHGGGKGANQAVAAARLGAPVSLVGAVGGDDAGRWMLEALARDGIDVRHVAVVPDAPTGTALVVVDGQGANSIVVSPGANRYVGRPTVSGAADLLAEAAVVVTQLEVPQGAVDALRAHARFVILNPAPVRPLTVEELAVDLCVPNAVELGQLLGAPAPRTPDEAVRLGRRLDGPAALVVTLGPAGAVVLAGDRHEHVPAPEVHAVDTTAAGDTACGALAAALAGGATLVEAVRFAMAAAAVSVTREGAQASIPWRHEVMP